MRTPVPRVDLRPDHWAIVRRALRRHVPDREVLAFGSRATWTAKDYSDLDLAVMGAEPLSLRTVSALDEALGDSDLPFKVDIVDWARIDHDFRSVIRRHAVSVQDRTRSFRAPAPTGRSPRQPRNSSAVSKWTSINLGRACTKIGSGATPRGGKAVYLPAGPYALIRSQNVLNEGFRHEGLAYIGERHAFDLAGVEVRDGDVLLNITGDSVARACQVDTRILPARVNQHVAIVRPDPRKLDPGFLRYYLVCPDTQARLLSWAGSGGTRNALTKAMIETFDMQAPEDVSEQRAIAQVLRSFDDKIELNRRMNETLEALARALFKSWFVDFDPVRAKIEGQGTGLRDDIDILFPDRFVDSNLGKIPSGWRTGTLKDIVSLNPESWTSQHHPDTVAYVDLANTKWGYIGKITSYPWKKAPSRARRVLRRGDTIVATVRPANGSFALVDQEGLTGSTGFAVLRPKELHDRESVWCASTSKTNIARLAHLADGAAYPAIRPPAVVAAPVALPDHRIRKAFSDATAPLLDRLEANKRESRSLATVRDVLLPMLVSGKINLRKEVS